MRLLPYSTQIFLNEYFSERLMVDLSRRKSVIPEFALSGIKITERLNQPALELGQSNFKS